MSNNSEFMLRAIELSIQSAKSKGGPFGCVIVKNNEIIAKGHNQVTANNDPTAHAEILALRDATTLLKNYRLPETTLYITIEPCSMCAGAIVHARVKHLVFAANEPKAGAIVSQDCFLDREYLNHQTTYQGGVLRDECAQLITKFFQIKRQP